MKGIAFADTNGDGYRNLWVLENFITNQDTIAGRMLQSYGYNTAFTSLPTPSSIAGGDVDADGYEDVIGYEVAGGGNPSGVGVIFGGGCGSVAIDMGTDTGGSGFRSLAVVDLNNDMRNEIVHLVGGASPHVRILKTTGTGCGSNFTVSNTVVLTPSSGAAAMRVVDIDGDGKPDIIVGGSTLDVFLNTSSGGTISFGSRQSVSAYTSILDLDVADFVGNGGREIVTVGYGSVDVYTVSSGVPSLLHSGVVGTSSFSVAVEAFDIDGDGWADLAIAESNGTVSFWVGFGTLSTPMFGTGPVFTVTGSAVSSILTRADVDNDGIVDIGIGGGGSSDVTYIYYNKSPQAAFAYQQSSGCAPFSSSLSLNTAVIGATANITVSDPTQPNTAVALFLTPNASDCPSNIGGCNIFCSWSYIQANPTPFGTGSTNGSGIKTFSFTIPPYPGTQGMLQVSVGTTVEDAVYFGIGY